MPEAFKTPTYLEWQAQIVNAGPTGNLWDELKSVLDIKQYVPLRAAGILSKELTDGSGHYFILKNPSTHSYVRLSPEEYWVWEQLNDGTTVQQMVVGYFNQFKAFAFAPILSLLDRLRENHMLQDPPRHLYAEVSEALQKQSRGYPIIRTAQAVFTKEFTIKNLDGHLERIYRYGGWILFTWPAQVLFLLVTVIGLSLFGILARDPQYNLLNLDTAVQLGLLAYIPLVIHEFGHAITAKHVGCEVYKGGVMLYYGMPAAFVDTTDVWRFNKRARLAVTWAGPYTGYIIGGACALVVYGFPHLPHATSVLLLQIALTGIVTTTLNILPLLKLDGYYLLSDALEIPRLRERSLDFILHKLRTKLAKRENWNREEAIFLAFGLVALLSTFYFTYAGVVFWDSQATTSLSVLLNFNGSLTDALTNAGLVIVAACAIYFSFSLIVDFLKGLYLRLQRRGSLFNRWRAAGLLLLLALATTLLARILLPTLADWFLLLCGMSAFAFAAWLSFSNFLSMRGSVHVWMWIPMSLAAILGAAGSFEGLPARWAEPAGLARLAALFLFLVSLFSMGRLLFSLRGSWRAVSLILVLEGEAILAVSTTKPASLEWNTLAGLLILAGLLHWSMRSTSPLRAGEKEASGSARERILAAFHEIRSSVLSEVELDFGSLSRKRLEAGAYRPRKKSVGGMDFSRSLTGMTPNDYGGALALTLEELLAGVERLGGKKYAWRALAYGFDKLHWELQETIEDYLLKYVPYATGLSNKLSESRNDLELLLQSVPLFMSMSEPMVRAVSRELKSSQFRSGEEIVRAGDPGDSFYIVRAGRLEVLGTVDFASNRYQSMDSVIKNDHAMFFPTKARRIAQLTRGDFFGESALLDGKPHAGTVRAVTPAEVLRLNKTDFDRLIRHSLHLDENARKELRLLGLLRQIPLFEGFEGGVLKSILWKFEEVKLNPGDSVFHQGDPADRFYIIEHGKVGISIDGEPRDTLGTGEYFGEIALLMNMPRTASVTALQPLTLLQLRANDFNKLVQDSSAMKQALERTSSRRALANERWIRQRQPA